MSRPSLNAALHDLADGVISPRDARANLRGLTPPNEPARFIKEGRWAVEGGYPTGIEGARMAAKDALDLIERPAPKPCNRECQENGRCSGACDAD